MSLEDLFGSDLEDSEDEERGKGTSAASGKPQLNELFGDSPSDEEAENETRRTPIKQQEFDSASASGHESDRSDEDDKQEEEEKEEINGDSHHQRNLTADLFGDDEELSSEEDIKKASPKEDYESEKSQQEDSRTAEDQIERQDILAEGEEGEEEEEETVIDVTIPYFKVSLGSEVFFVKMPNFLSVETKPFDSALYEDEIEDDEVLDEEGNARLKLKVENTIRWRSSKDHDGNDVKESNARVVRWSDGTMSLLLGGEVFDIHKTKIDGDFNHLFVQQGTGLQAQTVFKEKLTFRPHSTASQTHRKMTLSIADRASKAQKIRILPAAGKDPEAQRQEMIKKEEERLRTQLRRESQQRRIKERGHNRGLSAGYLEPDRYGEEEDDFQSLLALKKKYKKDLAKGYRSSLSDDDGLGGGLGGLESDEEEEDADKLLAAKEDKDLDIEPDGSRRKRTSSEGGGTKKRKKVIVESDDEESD